MLIEGRFSLILQHVLQEPSDSRNLSQTQACIQNLPSVILRPIKVPSASLWAIGFHHTLLQGAWVSFHWWPNAMFGLSPGLPETVSPSDPVWPDSPSATCCLEPAVRLSHSSHGQWRSSPTKTVSDRSHSHSLTQKVHSLRMAKMVIQRKQSS